MNSSFEKEWNKIPLKKRKKLIRRIERIRKLKYKPRHKARTYRELVHKIWLLANRKMKPEKEFLNLLAIQNIIYDFRQENK